MFSLRFILQFSLISIACWWIFSLVWNPGVIHSLARISYSLSSDRPSESVAYPARQRALLYAVGEAVQQQDIFFTPAEISHLVDVSHLYRPISFGLRFMAILSWGVMILAIYKRENLRPAFRSASRALLVLLVFLFTCLLLFPVFFDLFHRVLFPTGNWSFPTDSMLITIFPDLFWRLILTLIIVLLSASALLYFLLGRAKESESL